LGLLLAPTLEVTQARAQGEQPCVGVIGQCHSRHDIIVAR
jgi:hypothetical protein